MKMFLLTGVMVAAMQSSPSLGSTCYWLSQDGVTWPSAHERLCMESTTRAGEYRITLEIGEAPAGRTMATFILDEIDVLGNARVFGIATPNDSLFNDLQIELRFDTIIDRDVGEALIGANSYRFRRASTVIESLRSPSR